jgi:hypothetical protein
MKHALTLLMMKKMVMILMFNIKTGIWRFLTSDGTDDFDLCSVRCGYHLFYNYIACLA